MISFFGGVFTGITLACIGMAIATLQGWLVPRGAVSTPTDPKPALMPVLPPGFVWESGKREDFDSHFVRIRDLQAENKIVCRTYYYPSRLMPEPKERVRAARELYRANLSKLPGADNPENLGWV